MTNAIRKIGAILAAGSLAILAAACSKTSSDFGSTGPAVTKDTVVHDSSKASDTLRFASLNMSIGFPVSQLLFTNMDDSAIAYTVLDSLFKRYQRGLPNERIKGMAKAITALNLDVVGLQEVMSFTRDGIKVNDFLPELVAEIKKAGGPAYIAYGNPLNDTLLSGRLNGNRIEIKFHEGNGILVKPDFQVLDSARFIYFSLLPIPTNAGTKTQRCLGYMKIKSPKGIIWQVYNTHLEVFDEFSSSQALEMLSIVDSLKVRNGAGKDSVPQIVIGDFNVDPNTNAHTIMQEGGFRDTFDSVSTGPGYSCCLAASALWNPDTTFSNRRIDFIFARHIIKAIEHKVALDSAIVTDAGVRLSATDHRMIWTRVVGQ
jgi:endonuclease/exonuclease/phosphatase family metal-dependent hydrolase